MQLLRTNTAVRVSVGPFLDKTDGVTAKTALTVANCHTTLVAETDDNNAPTLILDNVAGNDGTNTLAHITGDDAGYYEIKLTAANLNRLGRAKLTIQDAANHCPVFEEFMIVPAIIYDAFVAGTDLFDVSVTQLLGTAWLTPGTAGTPDVNAKLIGGTAQTGRDIGASVLISPGSGAGQLDVTSGVIKSNLAQILGTALTETAGQIAAGFKKFFNIATPAATMDHGVLVDTVTTVSSAPTVNDVVDGIMNKATSGYTTSGTFGDYLRRMFLASSVIAIGTGSDATHIKFSTIDGAACSSTDDFYKGRLLIFITGTLKGQAVSISAYTGSTTTATISAATGSASNGDLAMLV
jgi:hypothetical protein